MADGLINVHKEAGWTSQDVCAKLRGILHTKKVGHTGTLDPDAAGVLVVCAGTATKLVKMLTAHDKEYIAVCRLGLTTDTQDLSGRVLTEMPSDSIRVRAEDVQRVLNTFQGTYEQIPPMYSAIKVGGKRLYEIARKGGEVERTPRPVTIHAIRLLETSRLEKEHLFTMEVRCSRGTYIRTLCADIGEALGTGAAMAHLTRTAAGSFRIEDAHTVAEIQKAADEGSLAELILPPERIFRDADRVVVKDHIVTLIKNGNAFAIEDTEDESVTDTAAVDKDTVPYTDGERVRVYDTNGTFYGIWRYDARKNKFLTEVFLYR